MDFLLFVFAFCLWFLVAELVYVGMRLFFLRTKWAKLYANLVALFWPITIPLGLLFLLILAIFRPEH